MYEVGKYDTCLVSIKHNTKNFQEALTVTENKELFRVQLQLAWSKHQYQTAIPTSGNKSMTCRSQFFFGNVLIMYSLCWKDTPNLWMISKKLS